MKNILLILLAFFIGCSTHKKQKNFIYKKQTTKKKITLKEDITTYTNKINIIIDSLIKIDDPRLKGIKTGILYDQMIFLPQVSQFILKKATEIIFFHQLKLENLKKMEVLDLTFMEKVLLSVYGIMVQF